MVCEMPGVIAVLERGPVQCRLDATPVSRHRWVNDVGVMGESDSDLYLESWMQEGKESVTLEFVVTALTGPRPAFFTLYSWLLRYSIGRSLGLDSSSMYTSAPKRLRMALRKGTERKKFYWV